jgi:hypothetical protein
MNERASLLELLRLLVAAGLIDPKVLVRDDGGLAEVEAQVQRGDEREPSRRRHLVSV